VLDGLYEKVLQQYLKDEMRIMNAHLPSRQKSLADLLSEEYPHVVCSDETSHLFKRKELNYLAGLITLEEQKKLPLPILIELHSDSDEASIISHDSTTEKVISTILDMPLSHRQERIILYKPQIALLRNTLKTTIQYVFSPGTAGKSGIDISGFTESLSS
jgi:uncharacterized protein